MLPVTPTTSGSNRRRQPAASAPSAARRVGHADDRHVAERAGIGGRSGDEECRRAGGDRLGEEGVPVGPLTGQRHEELAGRDHARIDGGATDRAVGAGRAAGRRSGGPGRRR